MAPIRLSGDNIINAIVAVTVVVGLCWIAWEETGVLRDRRAARDLEKREHDEYVDKLKRTGRAAIAEWEAALEPELVQCRPKGRFIVFRGGCAIPQEYRRRKWAKDLRTYCLEEGSWLAIDDECTSWRDPGIRSVVWVERVVRAAGRMKRGFLGPPYDEDLVVESYRLFVIDLKGKAVTAYAEFEGADPTAGLLSQQPAFEVGGHKVFTYRPSREGVHWGSPDDEEVARWLNSLPAR